MAALDVVLVAVLVLVAAGFLVWQLGLRRDKPPACHPAGANDDDEAAPDANVVVGGSLARGLDAARKKHESS